MPSDKVRLYNKHGLLGLTVAEKDEVKARMAEVRAEKIARGDGPREPPVEVAVGRDRRAGERFIGRST